MYFVNKSDFNIFDIRFKKMGGQTWHVYYLCFIIKNGRSRIFVFYCTRDLKIYSDMALD